MIFRLRALGPTDLPFLLRGLFVTLLLFGSGAFAQEPRASVIAQELPKLKSEYSAAKLKPLGPETAMSREYYQLLNRYVRFASKNFLDWPKEPGAKFHKRDGHREHDVRQNASVALAYAVLSKFGDYNESEAGLQRAQVKADLAALLRYLAVTHTNNFLATGDKLPWGDHWQSAYWTRIAGEAAWLVWDDLPDDTKLMVARMIVFEANRYNTRPPDDGEWEDTKAEENAWNSEVIALAACMFQKHPNAKLWQERAIVYMMNSFSTKADHEASRVVDGKRVRDWVSTVCIHPDYTLENHGRVHPDYMSAFNLNLHNPVLYRLGGLKVPDATYHHVMDTYHVLEHMTATNGPQFYLNGQDWWPHRMDNAVEFGGFLGVLKQDRNAAFLERAALNTHKKMHARFDDGRQFASWEFNYPNPEEDNMALYADLYLAHRLFGDNPKPATATEFQAQQCGVRIFDIGGFVTHRTPEKFVSFAWVNGAMGLIYPLDDTWFASPYERGLVGRITLQGVQDTVPKVEAHVVRELSLSPRKKTSGFSFVGKVSRCEGKIEQRVAMISLPGSPVLYVESLRAREAVDVREVATATFAVLNEDDKLFEKNERQIWTAEGAHLVRGAIKEQSQHHLWNTRWANIDDRLGVVAQASGVMSFYENHRVERARLQQLLSANYLTDLGKKGSGEKFSESVTGWFPNASHTTIPELHSTKLAEDAFDVRFEGFRILVNLGDDKVNTPDAVLEGLSADARIVRD